MLVTELRVAVDNQSAEALQNLIESFAKTAAANTASQGGGSSRRSEDIVLKLDGRELGRYVDKEMKNKLRTSSFKEA